MTPRDPIDEEIWKLADDLVREKIQNKLNAYIQQENKTLTREYQKEIQKLLEETER